jgi:penicillin-binding protein 1C
LAAAALYFVLPPSLDRGRDASVLVLASDGSILRGFLSADGKWRLPVEPDKVDPLYRRMLVAAEDARFASHPGVDPLAVLRASAQLAQNGHIVSGASTLTMQLARLLERHPRSLPAKLGEMARAVALERVLRKDEVLGLYLTLAPFGGNLEGVRAASLAYFGKEPARLSAAECALLVAIPRAPERLRPDRHPEAARAGRDRVLSRMATAGVISSSALAEARAEDVPRVRLTMPFRAPHLARALREEDSGRPSIAQRSIRCCSSGSKECRNASFWRSMPRLRSPRWSSTIVTGECWPMSETPTSLPWRAAGHSIWPGRCDRPARR